MNKGNKLYEGKAKIIYETKDKNLVIQHFKDDATAFNNLKKASEVFLTNSILGVRPVTKIDKISFDFGPKTKTIMKYSESLGI